MRGILFEWKGDGALAAVLRMPIIGVSYSYSSSASLYSMSLWHGARRRLELQSKMYDINAHDEIGVLQFIPHSEDLIDDAKNLIVFSPHIMVGSVYKLTIYESEIGDVDSGIVLCTLGGGDIKIVPGALPHSIAVDWGAFGSGEFSPEYPIEYYAKSKMLL